MTENRPGQWKLAIIGATLLTCFAFIYSLTFMQETTFANLSVPSKSQSGTATIAQQLISNTLSSNITYETNHTQTSVEDGILLNKRQNRLQLKLDQFDWTEFEKAASQQSDLSDELVRSYWNMISSYFDESNDVLPPIRVHYRPNPLSQAPDCKNHPFFHHGAITGERRKRPARVFDIFPFTYELDVLEMRLYELNDTVDYFLVIESTLTHRGTPKPLGYARNQVYLYFLIYILLCFAHLTEVYVPCLVYLYIQLSKDRLYVAFI